jgi:hypothetical protein
VRCSIAVCIWLGCFTPVAMTTLANPVTNAEFNPQVYSQNGQIVGCGFSFVVVWFGAEREILGAAGSINFFFLDASNFGSAFKMAGAQNVGKALVTGAWAEVSGYGDTKAFVRQAGEDATAYVSNKKRDANGIRFLLAAAKNGFMLGVNFEGRSLEETVDIPAAPSFVVAKINQCATTLISAGH